MLTAAAVKDRARALGFDLCGISRPDRFPELAALRDWLDRGYAGDMAYMARSADRRADVRAVVPGARSVVSLATVYNTVPAYAPDPPPDAALIARYARGDDYHDVLRGRMGALLEWMRAESPEPFEARAYVDTGPVQERVYAQYGGLGWIGKNTCLINPRLGSWLFLSEIICTLPLDPDVPALDQCGSCTRCLDACPTGALVEAHTLDSTRCISYLTIELRGPVPEPLRGAIDRHVYGCDICQDVCPYNQPAAVSGDPAWQPRPGLDAPPLGEIWGRSDTDVRALIRRSAMSRAGLIGLRRNVAVAMGNRAAGATAARLEEGGDDRASVADPMVAEHVRWAADRVRTRTDARTTRRA